MIYNYIVQCGFLIYYCNIQMKISNNNYNNKYNCILNVFNYSHSKTYMSLLRIYNIIYIYI